STRKWYLESYLKAPNAGGGDNFGWASAISEDTVVVGAPNEDNAQTTITNGPMVDAETGTAIDSGAAYVFKRTGDSWVQEAYLKAPNTFAGNRFANTVAISGDTIVIGSAFESSSQATITNGPTASANQSLSSSGAAYVFKRTGTTWTQEAYLKAPNPDSGDMFGANYYQGVVAISGDTIVAGAWGEDNSQTTIRNGTFDGADLGNAPDSGAAYVFKRTGNTWANEAYLKAPNAGAGDRFGKSVGISGDTIVVGAWNEGNSQTTISNGTFTGPDIGTAATSGAAYVFKRTGNTWANEAYLKAPNNSPGILFSWGLTISGDTIVVGANCESSSQTSITNGATANFDDSLYKSGAAYVFRRYGNTWTNEAYLKAPNAYMNSFFGDRVNLAGDTLVVGHFGDVSSQSTITHGPTVGMDRTLVDAGGVHVFKRTGTTWSYEAYLKPPNPDKNDWFGYSVGISGDSIVVGVPNEDSSQNTITSGASILDNNDLSNSGVVFVFKRNPKEGLTPLITDLSPRSFPLSGGGQMIIQGSGFQKGATVTISGTPCDNVFYQDYSELQCTIPPGSFAGPNSIAVTNPSGATTSDSMLFSYIGDPNALMSSGNSNTSIHLSWNPAGGSTRAYQVAYQSGNSAPTTCSNGTVIDESTVGAATSYTVSGLTAGTRYSFRVCAVDASGVLGSGITSSSFPQAPEPTSLAAAGSSTTQIALSWASGGTGTNQYQIAYQTGATAPADCFSGTVTKASTQGSTTTRTIGNLTAGTQYSFRVCAANADGFLSPGVTVSAYPSAPAVTGLTTIGASTTSITLTWTSGGVGTNQYQIAYQTGSSAPANCSSGTTVSASTVGSATSYTVSSLSAGTTYAFRVCATNTNGTFSTSVTAVGYPLAPNPSNFSVAAGSTSAVNLSWTSGGTGTSKYQIAYQSGATAPSDCSSGFVIPFSIVNTSTSFAIFGLTAGTNYSFRVCSTNGGNNLNSGVTVSGSPSSDGGSDISTFTSAGESSTSIALTWTSPSAASYQLAYRSGSTPPTSCASATGITTLDVGTVNSYTINSLTAGTQYSFRVCVRTSPGVFSAGATARSYPRAPEPNLSGTVGTSANQIKLTWTSGGTGTNQYQIAYQTGAVAPATCSAGTVIAASTVNNSLNYTIGSLIEGSQYSFRLCSTNLDGTLSTGVSSSAYPLATNVTSLTATGTSTSQIQLGWASGGLGTSQYQIAYKTGGTAPANCTTDTVISSGVVTNLTTYTVTGLSAGTQYAFRVCATNTDGTLSTGTTVTGYPAAPEPTGLTALPSYAGNIRLSWSSGGAGTNQYQIAFQSGAEAPADCTTGTILTASTVKNATTYDVGLSNGSTLFLLFSRTLYSFRVCATNSSGKLTSGITVSAYPPDNNLVGSILISEGTEYTSNPLVTLTLAALGGDQMYVTTMVGCLTGGTWEPFNSRKLWNLTSLNGINRLYVKYLDSAGNQSPCYGDSIVHDDTPPVTPVLSINGGASSTNSVLVDLSITATDLPAEMYVTNSPGCVDGGTWESFSSAKTAWVLNQMNSAASVFVKTRDMALNESVCATANINHDNQAPTLSSISITPVSPSSSATPTVQFDLSESATVTLYNGGSCSTAISA
ncbi:MAG: hypothetical protein EBQ85_00155, partial [Proteobacteria bacterium]|nr:hypothetical protein [Pseudomonadota bacterium]